MILKPWLNATVRYVSRWYWGVASRWHSVCHAKVNKWTSPLPSPPPPPPRRWRHGWWRRGPQGFPPKTGMLLYDRWLSSESVSREEAEVHSALRWRLCLNCLPLPHPDWSPRVPRQLPVTPGSTVASAGIFSSGKNCVRFSLCHFDWWERCTLVVLVSSWTFTGIRSNEYLFNIAHRFWEKKKADYYYVQRLGFFKVYPTCWECKHVFPWH